MRSPFRLLSALAVLALSLTQAMAQGLFDPVVQINDKVVTRYEVDQRAQFLSLLRAPGNPTEEALERLIEERLQVDAATRAGLGVTPEQVVAGQEEFAARANLSREEFIQALDAAGVAEPTFRDFVTAGLLWREVVRTRFGPRTQVSEAEIDRALAVTAPRPGGIRLLFSEIILPADTPAAKATSERRAAEIAQYTSFEQFAQAARTFSVSPSRARGGRLDWVEAANIQPGLAQVLLGLAPGQVTNPLPIPNAIALFQLREVEDGLAPPPEPLTVDYAVYYLPGGRNAATLADASRISAEADTCNDLFDIARGQPPERLERVSAEMAEIPADIALELAKLDDGEISTGLSRGGNLALVMLCSRRIPLPEAVTRVDVRRRLVDQRLNAYADAYLAELRADAIIRTP